MSPVHALFAESIRGVVSIRAYGYESFLHTKFRRRVDRNALTLLSTASNVWFLREGV